MPDMTAACEPHADALRLHEAVLHLDSCRVQVPDGWNPFANAGLTCEPSAPFEDAIDRAFEGMTASEGDVDLVTWDRFRSGTVRIRRDGARVLRAGSISDLLQRSAVMGGRPRAGDFSDCQVDVVRHANGRKAWFVTEEVTSDGAFGDVRSTLETVNGWDAKAKRPKPGAYTKATLRPDTLIFEIEQQARFELWWCAIKRLVQDLNGKLAEHSATMPADRLGCVLQRVSVDDPTLQASAIDRALAA